MIQFNLLPEVKKDYIKAKRTKQVIIGLSSIVSIASIVVVLLLLSFVHVVQKGHIDDLSEDIKTEISSLNSIEDLNKTLTVQNQITTLPELHQKKPLTSRVFQYLNQTTPITVKIRSVALNIESNSMTISGSADSLASINQYADTLKFAKYKVVGTDELLTPFTNVNTELSRGEETATYTVKFEYSPDLFDNTLEIELIIPEQITTRSITGKPSLNNDLFEENPNLEEQ